MKKHLKNLILTLFILAGVSSAAYAAPNEVIPNAYLQPGGTTQLPYEVSHDVPHTLTCNAFNARSGKLTAGKITVRITAGPYSKPVWKTMVFNKEHSGLHYYVQMLLPKPLHATDGTYEYIMNFHASTDLKPVNLSHTFMVVCTIKE